MHATFDRNREADGDALFLADLPDRPTIDAVPADVEPRSVYGAQTPSWTTIVAIALFHVAAFYALVKFDVIHIAEKPKVLVVDLIAEPPAPPAEKPKPQPVVEKVQPVVFTPAPIVQTTTPPPPITVTTTPPPPKPVQAAPAPPPAGPVTVGNLDERMIEGKPPRYPMESRRKKEQGTVMLRLLIGTDGRIQDASIAQSSGFDRLDQAALQAARTWRWQPMIRNGVAIEVRGVMPIPFVLQG